MCSHLSCLWQLQLQETLLKLEQNGQVEMGVFETSPDGPVPDKALYDMSNNARKGELRSTAEETWGAPYR